MREVKLGNKVLGDGHPTYIIAEMAWSHDGSVEKAQKIIRGAADAGADAISVHITSLKDYMVPDYGCSAGQTVSAGKEQEKIYDYLNRINLKNSDWEEVFPYAKKSGLAVCSMPNDIKSLRLCEKLKPDMYVIASSCFVEENLVSEVAKQGKPVILRIGGATLGEIENTISLIRGQGTEDIILLHGIQLYPTKTEDTQLRLLPSLKAIFGLPIGLADHVDAESELALVIPLIGIPMGAVVIEKHITHDRSLKGEDIEAALNPDEFKKFVGYIREAEKALGTPYFGGFSKGVLKYRTVSRKRVVCSRKINKGEKITVDDIAFKRADEGIYPDEIKYMIGRTVNRDIAENVPITWDKLL
jgi:sialic acid synthase SpsE